MCFFCFQKWPWRCILVTPVPTSPSQMHSLRSSPARFLSPLAHLGQMGLLSSSSNTSWVISWLSPPRNTPMCQTLPRGSPSDYRVSCSFFSKADLQSDQWRSQTGAHCGRSQAWKSVCQLLESPVWVPLCGGMAGWGEYVKLSGAQLSAHFPSAQPHACLISSRVSSVLSCVASSLLHRRHKRSWARSSESEGQWAPYMRH